MLKLARANYQTFCVHGLCCHYTHLLPITRHEGGNSSTLAQTVLLTNGTFANKTNITNHEKKNMDSFSFEVSTNSKEKD